MSILRKPYQLSVWQDVQVEGEDHTYSMQEERIAIIGSHKMRNQNKAMNLKLTRNINGNIKFSFEMFSRYVDTITGKETSNPFVDLLKNETKLKLFYDNNWYDLIVKKVNEDSGSNLNQYEAISQHINELSKNGFNVELNASLYNNTNDILTLAQEVLADTDWEIDVDGSDFIVQTQIEPLIPLVIPKDTTIQVYHVDDSGLQSGRPLSWERDFSNETVKPQEIKVNADTLVFAFYSSCTAKPSLFQFYYFGDGATYDSILNIITTNDDRTITTKGYQYCMPVFNEGDLNQYIKELEDYKFYIPKDFEFSPQQEGDSYVHILTKVRGERYVFGEDSEYNYSLEQVLYKCTLREDRLAASNKESFEKITPYWYTKTTDYVSPIVVENLGGNNDFKDTSGWKAGVVCRPLMNVPSDLDFSSYIGKCTPFNEFDLIKKNWGSEIVPGLYYSQTATGNTINANNIIQQCLISSGPYDNRTKIRSIKKGDKYNVVLRIKDNGSYGDGVELSREMQGAKIEIAYHPYNIDLGCYGRITTYTDSLMLSPITYDFGLAILQRNKGVAGNNQAIQDALNNMEQAIMTATGPKKDVAKEIYESLYKASRNQYFYEQYYSQDEFSFFKEASVYWNLRDLEHSLWAYTTNQTGVMSFAEAFYHVINKFEQDQNCVTKENLIDQSAGSVVLTYDETKRENMTNALIDISTGESIWWEGIWDDHYLRDDKNQEWKEYWGHSFIGDNSSEEFQKYDLPEGRYAIAQLEMTMDVDEAEFSSKNFQIYIYPSAYTESDNNPITQLEIVDFQLVKHAEREIEDANTGVKSIQYITPSSQNLEAVKNTTYDYYSDADIQALNNGSITKEQLMPVATSINQPHKSNPEDLFYTYEPCYYETGKKVRSVTVKESNYFNIISTLSETFEQWPEFVITRDNNNAGNILSKKIRFKNHIGVENQSGFRPGVNLKDIKRAVNSTNVVTKMIVKPNVNKLAPDGMCTIAQAYANETGETALYDFSYYINHGLIDREKLSYLLYNVGHTEEINGKIQFLDMFGDDVKEFYPDAKYDPENNGKWTPQNYYNRLKILNNKLLDVSDMYVEARLEKISVEAEYKIQNNAINEAQNECEVLRDEIQYLTQKQFPDSSQDLSEEWKTIIEENNEIKKRFTQWSSNQGTIQKYSKTVEELEKRLNYLESLVEELNEKGERYTKFKQELNKAFFKLYGRFIQEGTWLDQQYIDPEKYYADALSTLYTSAQPQIQYTINVNEISSIPGFEHYKYSIGDKTHVEDPDFFGYVDGYPYREEVVLTETVDYLDDVSKNNLKVQNYKTQFQDLFQRITASVQSTKFAEGAYQRAVERTSTDSDDSIQFLQTALGNENMEIKNAGSPSISWGEQGLIIKDTVSPSKQLRLIGGQIMYSTVNSSGDQIWKTMLSSDGISASTINTGRINTEKVEISHKNAPTFAWDGTGLTAYAWTDKKDGFSVIYGQGVRFDKCGIYGYNLGASGAMQSFNPFDESNDMYMMTTKEASEYLINNPNVSFYLGWSGLKVSQKINDASYSMFLGDGAAEFGSDGQNEFISIVENQGLETESTIFSVSPSGVYMKGTVNAEEGELGAWRLGKKGLYSVANGGSEEDSDIYLYASPKETLVNEQNKNLLIRVGDNLFVEDDGSLTTHKGVIGNWNLLEGYLYTPYKDFYLYGGFQERIAGMDKWLQPEYNTLQWSTSNGEGILNNEKSSARLIIPNFVYRTKKIDIWENQTAKVDIHSQQYQVVNYLTDATSQELGVQIKGYYDKQQAIENNIIEPISAIVSGSIKVSKDSVDDPIMGYILGSQVITIERIYSGGDQALTFSISFANGGSPIEFSQYDYTNQLKDENVWGYFIPGAAGGDGVYNMINMDTYLVRLDENSITYEENVGQIYSYNYFTKNSSDIISLPWNAQNGPDGFGRIMAASQTWLTPEVQQKWANFLPTKQGETITLLCCCKIPIRYLCSKLKGVAKIDETKEDVDKSWWNLQTAIYSRDYTKGAMNEINLIFSSRGKYDVGIMYAHNPDHTNEFFNKYCSVVPNLDEYEYEYIITDFRLTEFVGMDENNPKFALLGDGSMYVDNIKLTNTLMFTEDNRQLFGRLTYNSSGATLQFPLTKHITVLGSNDKRYQLNIVNGLIFDCIEI